MLSLPGAALQVHAAAVQGRPPYPVFSAWGPWRAWLCWARMAGPSVYFGVPTPKPWLGPSAEDEAHYGLSATWDARRLSALCSLLWWSTLCGGLGLWLAALVLVSGAI